MRRNHLAETELMLLAVCIATSAALIVGGGWLRWVGVALLVLLAAATVTSFVADRRRARD